MNINNFFQIECNMKIGIMSNFDCLLEIEGKRYEMTANFSRLEIMLEKDESVSALVYPINARGQLSYVVSIDEKNVFKSNLDICKIGEDEYEVVLKPYYLTGQNFFKKKFKHENLNFCFSISYFNTLSCEDKEGEIFLEIYEKLDNFKFDVLNGVPYFHCKTMNGFEILVLYDKKNHEFMKYESNTFDFNDNFIDFVSSENTISKHGRHYKIICDKGEIKIEEELVYLKGAPQKIKSDVILPYAFFEAVKVKDFELAKSFLSEKLKAHITNEVLMEYFGEYDKIKPYNFHVQKGSYICLEKKGNGKVFRIKIENGEIDEIENVGN